MKATTWIVAIALLVVPITGVQAGQGHAKAAGGCDAPAGECLQKLSSKINSKAWLGVSLEKNAEGRYQVASVQADSPAEAAGLQKGDVLLALNGIKLSKENKKAIYKVQKASLKSQQAVTYTIARGGSKQKVAVTFSPVPAAVMAQWIGEHMVEHHLDRAG